MECPICFQLYSTSQPYAVKLDCSHILCNICGDRIRSSNSLTCPMCLKITMNANGLPKCKTVEKLINLLLNRSDPQNNEKEELGIVVRNLKGNIMSFTLNKNKTVLGLKEQLKEIEGIEVSSQWLLFGGKALINENTLEDCGVTDGSMIYLVVRSFGG